MAKFEFGFIGWCKEDNHDKIWGYFYRPTPRWTPIYRPTPGWTANRYDPDYDWGRNCCIFWGRRGKALQFKASEVDHKMEKLVQSKLRKGYTKISDAQLTVIWPTFEEEAEPKLLLEVLSGRVK